MTEEDARFLVDGKELTVSEFCDLFKLSAAENQQYRAIGTVEELANMKRNEQWVPTITRLPIDGVDVQVCYIGHNDHKPHSDGVAYISNGHWYWSFSRSSVNVQLTHWKPLSQPPKEAETNECT